MNYNAVDPFDVPEEKSSNGPLIVVVVLLLVLVGLLGVWLYSTFRGSDQPEVTAAPTTVTSTKASHTPLKDVPTTVTLTTTASPTKESSTSSAYPTTSLPTQSGVPTPERLPNSAVHCGDARRFGVAYFRGNDVTSCEFAQSVAEALMTLNGSHPSSSGKDTQVRAVSPVTGDLYDMRCSGGYRAWKCTGGNNATVYLQPLPGVIQ